MGLAAVGPRNRIRDGIDCKLVNAGGGVTVNVGGTKSTSGKRSEHLLRWLTAKGPGAGGDVSSHRLSYDATVPPTPASVTA